MTTRLRRDGTGDTADAAVAYRVTEWDAADHRASTGIEPHLELTAGRARLVEDDFRKIGADREVERHLPDFRGNRGDAVERRSVPDPAGMHDVAPMDAADPGGGAVIFEPQRDAR